MLILKDPPLVSIGPISRRGYLNDINTVKINAFKPRIKNEGILHLDVLIAACSEKHPDPKFSTIQWGASHGIPLTISLGEVFISPYFADSILRKHCLIFVDGFYANRNDPKNGRVPYFIQSVFGQPFALAGIWRAWKGHDGNLVSGCTILLRDVQPESKLGYINNKELTSPIILPQEKEKAWLTSTSEQEARLILATDTDSLIQAHTISPAVNLKNMDPYNPILTSHIAYTDAPII